MPRKDSFRASCLLASILIISASGAFAQTGGVRDVPSLITEVENNQRLLAIKLRDYSYTVKRIEQKFNKEGETTDEKIIISRAFPTSSGKLVSMPISENGNPLSSDKAAKEKARAKKEWEKAQLKAPAGRGEGHIYAFLDFLRIAEFSDARLESHNGRDVIVINFRPKESFKPTNDQEKFVASFGGEMWVDLVDKIAVRIDAKMSRRFKPGGLSGLLSSLEPGTSLIFESKQLPNGLWAPSFMEFKPIADKRRNVAVTPALQSEEMSDYRLFSKDDFQN